MVGTVIHQPKQTWDLYPVMAEQFKDPTVTSIDVGTGMGIRRFTREEFERERLVRDARMLAMPIRRAN